MNENEAHRLLSSAPLWNSLRSSELRFLVQSGRIESWDSGETVVRQDVPAVSFYIVLTGRAEVRVGTAAVRTVEAGEYFGELGLLEHTARTASVVADGALTTLSLPRAAFEALLSREPDFAAALKSVARARCAADSQRLATPDDATDVPDPSDHQSS